MKPILVVFALVCTASPAFAQPSKVYTNADLTSKPVATWTKTVTPAEWSGIVSRQFIPPLDVPVWGPRVYVAPWAGDRPGFLPDNNAIVMAGSSSYADRLWSDPVSAYALQHPIEAAYGFAHSYGSTFSRTPRAHVPSSAQPFRAAAVPSSPPAPPIVTTAASAGRRVR